MSAPPRGSELIVLVYFAVVCSVTATAMAVMLHHRGFGLAIHGVEDGAVVRAATARHLGIAADDPSTLDRVDVFVDDQAVGTRRDGNLLRLTGFEPAEGSHTVRARVRDTSVLGVEAELERTFTVDDTAPALSVARAEATDPRAPVTIRGTADGAATVRVGHSPAHLVDGRFEATVPSAATVFVEARDPAGNTTRRWVTVAAPRPQVRATRLGPADWPSRRDAVFRSARQGEIDTVVLDVKDENGHLAHPSEVPLAQRIGAVEGRCDLRTAVRDLHAAGMRAVARVVAFHDPVLARASWQAGLRDHVLHDGTLTRTDPEHPEVRGYVVAIAAEAAALGFDDVLLDHAGGEGFLAEARDAVRAAGARLGVVVPRDAQDAQDGLVDADFTVIDDSP
ncbi:putative glycoside hydrolase [Lentzea sp. NPDC003310]|uniref:putative glycoside hydrolase n=1 Tax=Lentzea sp. NPDC003310 TaxID=3154447 RepID=UPI0033A17080